MNNSKTIYIAIATVVAIVVIFAVILRSDSGKDSNSKNEVAQSQDQKAVEQQKPEQSKQKDELQKTSEDKKTTPPQGCPNGQPVNSLDERGRFKPTIDISNKQVVLDTSMGKITIQLYDKDTPKTVENFICLAQKGYYNNVTFHRVARGFVIQAGDPTGTGAGGESVYGDRFEDELYSDTPSYKAGYLKGVVAMANKGPNTNSSQFFILLSDRPELPKNYTIFGKVSTGQDVVDKIGMVPITPGLGPQDGAPVDRVVIKSAIVK